jgi:hypothetical protein
MVHARLGLDAAVGLRHARHHARGHVGATLPMSIWPTAMSYLRPSSDAALVSR